MKFVPDINDYKLEFITDAKITLKFFCKLTKIQNMKILEI